MRTSRTLLVSMALSMAWGMAVPSVHAEDGVPQQVEFNIQAQPMEQALTEFGAATGLQVLFDSKLAAQVSAPGVVGSLSAEEALRRLLAGSSLSFEFINARTVAIRGKGAPQDPVRTSHVGNAESGMRLAQVGTPSPDGTSGSQSGETQPAAQENAGAGKVEEVVVTAQRRQERLQDVPISITVLSGERLDASTSGGVLDELSKVPAMTLMPQPEGRSIMVIRGVSPQAGVSPVGYYFDAVPISSQVLSLAPDVDVYDLQRVEVLKGPQGTGYGIGSSSGVVRVLTNDPDPSKLESKGRVSVSSTQGGGTNYRADAAVNAPIIDGRLAIRGVVGLENWSGWIDRPNKKDSNDGDGTNIRLKIGGELIDGLNTVAGIWHSKRSIVPAAADDSGNRSVLYDETANTSNDVYSFVLRKDFGAFSLVSSTSYANVKADYFKRSIFTLSGNVLVNIWNSRSTSQEINLTSNGAGPWKWTAGVFYRTADERYKSRLGPLATINTLLFTTDETYGSDSYAGFGELSYAFSQIELLGGVRYSKEKRDYTSFVSTPNYTDDGSFSKVTPRLVLSWKPNRDATTYLSYAEGFRSGVLQSQAAHNIGFGSVKSDLLHNYELGHKANLFGGALALEAAVYYMKWDDVQQGVTFPFGGTFFGGTANAGSASGIGGEVSVTLRPVERFEIGGSYSQNDLELDEDVKTAGGTITLFHKGDRMAISPKTTYGAFANYTAPVGADLEFQVGANMSHASSQIQRFLLTTVTDINDDPFTMVGLNVGIGRNDGSRKLTLFVDNLTDEDAAVGNKYSSSNPPVGNPDEGLRVRPRTVGVQVEMKF